MIKNKIQNNMEKFIKSYEEFVNESVVNECGSVTPEKKEEKSLEELEQEVKEAEQEEEKEDEAEKDEKVEEEE